MLLPVSFYFEDAFFHNTQPSDSSHQPEFWVFHVLWLD